MSQLDRGRTTNDKISRLIWGARQGQLSRFEDTVLASMGEFFIDRHPWARDTEWVERFKTRLAKLAKGGMKIGAYVPGRRTDEQHD
jgi:putative GTP pyrophosphokinase